MLANSLIALLPEITLSIYSLVIIMVGVFSKKHPKIGPGPSKTCSGASQTPPKASPGASKIEPRALQDAIFKDV